MKIVDRTVGFVCGVIGGGSTWLNISHFIKDNWLKGAISLCGAFMLGMAGTAGKDVWYVIRAKIKFFKTKKNRANDN